MEKSYQPNKIESLWYAAWEKAGLFQPKGQGQAFCVMLPPPNVTGHLHMGHAFQDTLMDILIRSARMQGKNTLWQVGTDHAGIATQMVVERQLAEKNQRKETLGREAFLEAVWAWKAESGQNILRQMRRLGASGDWSRERFTMDEGLSEAVKTVFIRLYEEGFIYRGNRLVNWDPVLKTALSDLEVLTEEEPGFLWHIRYPIVGRDDFLVVATTRPETLLGDVAVAVHPTDERYAALIGQQVMLPLVNRPIPIIADDYVDPTFGTGCVKITPGHDFNDYEMGLRHQLPIRSVFSKEACFNDTVPETYRGLDRFEGRKQILQALKTLDLLVKEEPYTVRLPRGDRSGAVVEPMLTQQWYMKMADLAKPALEAVRSGEIQFVPQNWENTYYAWLENIQDWCISRQLWWGHRIPAWYDSQGNIFVGENEEAIRQKYSLSAEVVLEQDNDVLDTWFSSALWPFSTLGWPQNTPELQTFYPTNVLVTGFDIIFFWVARMIMMGMHCTGKIPFKTIYVHGLIQDSEGQKMSKSKGNTIDPIDVIDGIDLEKLIEKRTLGLMQPHLKEKIIQNTRKHFPNGMEAYGTDALRFTFCALASTGRHIRFDLARVEGYRHFCNKIWNAARYVILQVEPHQSTLSGERQLSKIDLWIETLFSELVESVTRHLEQYRFDLLAQEMYQFVWNVYCDWYLEFTKPLLANPSLSEAQKNGTRYTLVSILERTLRLLHPIMPFISEEIWQKISPLLGQKPGLILEQAFPTLGMIDESAKNTVEWLKALVSSLRNCRSERNIPPNKMLKVYYRCTSVAESHYLSEYADFLKALVKCEPFIALADGESAPPSAMALAGSLELFIPISEFSDPEAERLKVEKEVAELRKKIEGALQKLNNPAYVEKAPPAVVQKEREKLAEWQAAIRQKT